MLFSFMGYVLNLIASDPPLTPVIPCKHSLSYEPCWPSQDGKLLDGLYLCVAHTWYIVGLCPNYVIPFGITWHHVICLMTQQHPICLPSLLLLHSSASYNRCSCIFLSLSYVHKAHSTSTLLFIHRDNLSTTIYQITGSASMNKKKYSTSPQGAQTLVRETDNKEINNQSL